MQASGRGFSRKEFLRIGGGGVAGAFVLGIAACGGGNTASNDNANPEGSSEGLTNVDLILDWGWWPPQAPMIVAKEKGFYEDVGLNVQLRESGGSSQAVSGVGAGDFPIGYADLTTAAQAISKDVPITGVAAVADKKATSLIYLPDTPVREPQDVRGLTIGSTAGGSDSQILPAFLAANNIPESAVTVNNLPGDAKLQALFTDRVDVVSGDAYYYEVLAKGEGYEADSLSFAENGAPTMGKGFIVNNQFMEENPDVLRRFLKATFRGFEYTYNNMSESIDIYLEVSGLDQSPEEVEDVLVGYKELFATDSFGRQDKETWVSTLDILEDYGSMKNRKPVEEYFTNEFVPEGYSID